MASTGRFSKRGKNIGTVDTWLESLGYYRKNVAYDETCLFRAISEQLFLTQLSHETVRKRCISYGKQHSRQFQYLVPRKRDWMERLRQLSVHMIVCNEIEIQLTCNAFKVNVHVFNAAKEEVEEYFSHTSSSKTLLICKMSDDHYDAVYSKEHIATAGFCQSVVYNVLYEGVFGISNIDSVVRGMLHEKQFQYSICSSEVKEAKNEDNEVASAMDSDDSAFGLLSPNLMAPFPFKIAKALDPNMYRNIEYDTWLELRREMRLGEWYYGDDKLILGTRCILNLDGVDQECYIQTMFDDDSTKCEVYLTKVAERLTVDYTQLRPEDDAKPWPLPYRFVRNQSQPLNNSAVEFNGERKNVRKRKDKKRLQYASEELDSPHLLSAAEMAGDVSLSNYEGCPLLMQEKPNPGSSEQLPSSSEGLVDTNNNSTLSENVSWSNSQNDILMQASPQQLENAIYQEPAAEEMNYGYNPDMTYPKVSGWTPASNGQYYSVVTPDSGYGDGFTSPSVDANGNPQTYVYYSPDNAYAPSSYIPSPAPYALPQFPAHPSFPIADRVVYPTVASPGTGSVEMYPYVNSTPGTPLCYSQPVTPNPVPVAYYRPQDFVVSSAPPLTVYNGPPVEMQYINPSPYVCTPTTPPVTWYNHPHINSQGFIFPQPASNNNNINNNINN